ncbi:MAG TPA: ArsR family transcriptional regulator [Ktedonobacterales bacterium]|nr:ArsR family transcriptional regulator [Ktedonobacterales bacterium]
MAEASLERRFFASTRGQLLLLLRRNPATVEELASALRLTDNAVRVHLAALERDGLARQCGVRRGGGSGKPAFEYALTEAAERLFPRPYGEVLGLLLGVLAERLPPDELAAAARETGRQLARQVEQSRDGSGDCISAAVAVLNQMGGLAERDEAARHPAIVARSCPLADIVADHPAACAVVEALVGEIAGQPMRASCATCPPAHCRFEAVEQVSAAGASQPAE